MRINSRGGTVLDVLMNTRSPDGDNPLIHEPLKDSAPKEYLHLRDNSEVQNILNAIPFAALLVDSEHNLLVANECAKRNFDLDRKQSIGNCCPLMIYDREMPLSDCPLAETLHTGVAAEREVFDARQSRWIHLSIFPTSMITGDNRPIYLHFARDLTQDRLKVDALSQSVEHHGALCRLLQNLQHCRNGAQILDALIDQVLSLSWLGITATAVGFLVQDQRLEMVAHRNLSPAQQKRCAVLALGECLCGKVAQTGKDMFCTSEIAAHSIRYEGMLEHRHAIIPISHEDRVLGILTLYLERGEELNDFRIDFLKASAAASGAALAGHIARENAKRVREKSLAKMISYQEDQRKHIAWELHEQVCQSLSALLLEMHSHGNQHPALMDIAAGCESRVRTLIEEVRQMATQLRPSILDDYGLELALRRYIDDLSSAHRELVIDFQFARSTNQTKRLPVPIEVNLYRVAMEALSNVIAHARASRASVILLQQPDKISLLIEDNGCGFDYIETRRDLDHCLGLIDIKERVIALGGTLHIESIQQKGTTVRAEIPMEMAD
jgi:signal transduction histidine kinase